MNLNPMSPLLNPKSEKMHGTKIMTIGIMAKPIRLASKAKEVTSPKGNLRASTLSLGAHLRRQ
eukprot:9456688-Prorocentrum_lima.AAC.1